MTCESASDEEVSSHLGEQSTGAQSLSDEIADGGECLLGGQPSTAQESTPGAGSPKSNHDDATTQSNAIVEVNGVGDLDGQPRGALAERSVCATMAKHATTATQTPPREYETTAAQTDLDEQLVWQIGGRQGAHSLTTLTVLEHCEREMRSSESDLEVETLFNLQRHCDARLFDRLDQAALAVEQAWDHFAELVDAGRGCERTCPDGHALVLSEICICTYVECCSCGDQVHGKAIVREQGAFTACLSCGLEHIGWSIWLDD